MAAGGRKSQCAELLVLLDVAQGGLVENEATQYLRAKSTAFKNELLLRGI